MCLGVVGFRVLTSWRCACLKFVLSVIRLADYLVVNALERMCVESVGNLVEAMQELFAKINDPDVEEVVEEGV